MPLRHILFALPLAALASCGTPPDAARPGGVQEGPYPGFVATERLVAALPQDAPVADPGPVLARRTDADARAKALPDSVAPAGLSARVTALRARAKGLTPRARAPRQDRIAALRARANGLLTAER